MPKRSLKHARSLGLFRRYGVGVEARSCIGEAVCFFADLDMGYQALELSSDNEPDAAGVSRGVLLGPRFGLDSSALRVRVAAELYGHFTTSTSYFPPDETGLIFIGGLSVGLAGQI